MTCPSGPCLKSLFISSIVQTHWRQSRSPPDYESKSNVRLEVCRSFRHAQTTRRQSSCSRSRSGRSTPTPNHRLEVLDLNWGDLTLFRSIRIGMTDWTVGPDRLGISKNPHSSNCRRQQVSSKLPLICPFSILLPITFYFQGSRITDSDSLLPPSVCSDATYFLSYTLEARFGAVNITASTDLHPSSIVLNQTDSRVGYVILPWFSWKSLLYRLFQSNQVTSLGPNLVRRFSLLRELRTNF